MNDPRSPASDAYAPAVSNPQVARWIRIRSRWLPAILLCALTCIVLAGVIYGHAQADDRDLLRTGASTVGRVVGVRNQARGSGATFAVNFVATGKLRQVTLRGLSGSYELNDRVTVIFDRTDPYRALAPGLQSTSSDRPEAGAMVLLIVGLFAAAGILSPLTNLIRVRRVAMRAPLTAWTTAHVDIVPSRVGRPVRHDVTLTLGRERLLVRLPRAPVLAEPSLVAVHGHTAIVASAGLDDIHAARRRYTAPPPNATR